MSVILTNEYMDPARVIFGVVLGLHVSGLRFLGAVPWGSGPEMGSKKALPPAIPFWSPSRGQTPTVRHPKSVLKPCSANLVLQNHTKNYTRGVHVFVSLYKASLQNPSILPGETQ